MRLWVRRLSRWFVVPPKAPTIATGGLVVVVALLAAIVWASDPGVAPYSRQATLARVVDGDTAVLRLESGIEVKVRLWGIDAPETRQDFGRQAKDYLALRLRGRALTVKSIGRRCSRDTGLCALPNTLDRYGRELAVIWTGDADVNRDMISTGHAWAYRYGSSADYRSAQDDARDARRGLWASNPESIVEPYVWRKLRRAAALTIRN